MFDVVVAGGGPAGLNAALVLGRVRRKVLVCDTGTPRNAGVAEMHGFLSRDGHDPAVLRDEARRQLVPYESVQVRDEVRVRTAERVEGGGFRVRLSDGTERETALLLFATGVVDELPPIPGLAALWGKGVFSCPFCDGWEHRDRPLAVLGGTGAPLLAMQLRTLSDDVVLCSDGPAQLADAERDALAAAKVPVHEGRIAGVASDDAGLSAVEFADAPAVECRAAFLHPPTRQASELPAELGCTMLEDGSVAVDDFGMTDVPSVFAAGDMARRRSVPVAAAAVVLAAAEGATAAAAMHTALIMREAGTSTPPV